MSIENQFDAAVKVIQSLPKDGFFQPSDEVRLRFYAFYKQATEGPNLTKKPAFYELVNRYKWNAWKQCGDMSRFEAMRLYVEELKKVFIDSLLTIKKIIIKKKKKFIIQC
ncbi:Acyl CoA binding protein-like protein [Sarcoptes scabiei]|uniref:Acyl CoA binding protein-like protein n=1 Tax=Sarcoptes scabiei TaxID=52283 RepID=A0A132A057_SARSC|nr:Acyl CoA binding protein-like protein [Sarcoptes scabiei]